MKKNLIGIILILLIHFVSCEKQIEKLNDINHFDFPEELTKNTVIYYSDSALLKVKIYADKVERRKQGKKNISVFPKGILVEFYNKKKQVESKITCNKAVLYDEKIVEAKNNVMIINKKGEKLNTEFLTWNRKEKTISTNAFVKITTKEEIIYGEGLKATEDFSQYQISNIKSIISINEN